MNTSSPKAMMMELVNQAAEKNFQELSECGGDLLKIRLYCKQRAYERVLATLLGQEMKMITTKVELLYQCMTQP